MSGLINFLFELCLALGAIFFIIILLIIIGAVIVGACNEFNKHDE